MCIQEIYFCSGIALILRDSRFVYIFVFCWGEPTGFVLSVVRLVWTPFRLHFHTTLPDSIISKQKAYSNRKIINSFHFILNKPNIYFVV